MGNLQTLDLERSVGFRKKREPIVFHTIIKYSYFSQNRTRSVLRILFFFGPKMKSAFSDIS